MSSRRGQLSGVLEWYDGIRRSWPIAVYRPRERQDRFHRSKAGTRVLSGGNQSGKTTALLAEVWAMLMGFRPWLSPDDPDFWVLNLDGRRMEVPNQIRVVCTDYPNGLAMTIFPKFMEFAPADVFTVKKNSQGYPTQVHTTWGSDAYFMSHEQDPKKHESGTFHGVANDEPPPRPIRIANLRGLMKTAGPELFAMTPIYESYLLNDIYGDGAEERGVEIVKISTRDNTALSKRAVDRFEAALTPMEKMLRMEGDTHAMQGRVWPSFQAREPWVCEPFGVPSDWYRVMVIDPHPNKPDGVIWWAVDPEFTRSVIYAERFGEDTRGTVKQTCATIREVERGSGGAVCRRLMDPRAAKAMMRDVGRTLQEDFAAHGIRCEAAPGLDRERGFKLGDAWFRVNPMTGLPFCQVFSGCERVIYELQHLMWVMDMTAYEPKLRLSGPDDMSSCLRYLVTWNPHVEKLRLGTPAEDDGPGPLDVLVGAEDTGDGTFTGY